MLSIAYSYTGGSTTTIQLPDNTSPQAQTAAIQAALDAVAGNPGATVTLSAGTFSITGTGNPADGCLRVGSGTTFEGTGLGATVLQLAAGSTSVTGIVRTDSGATLPDGTAQSTSDVLIRNLAIDGNHANTTGDVDGFFCGPKPGSIVADTNITVDGVEIRNVSRYGFDPHEQTVGLTISNCVARDNGLDGFTIDFCSDVTLSGNVAYANGRHGFNIVTSSHEVTLLNCEAYGNASSGLTIQTGDNEARQFTENVTVSGGSYHDNARHGIEAKQSLDLVIENATVTGNGLSGIALRGVDGATLSNNTITGNNGFAVKVDGYLQTFADGDAANDRYLVSANITVDGNAIAPPAAPTGVTMWDWSLTAGDDSIVGSSAIDRFATGSGNDTIDGGAGADLLYGGAGNDTYLIDTYLDTVVEITNQGTDTVISTSSYIMAANVENLTLAMGAGLIDGLGNGLGNVITGNDSRNGIAGGSGHDTIFGLGGDDAIDGGVGADSMVGGTGVDTYYVDNIGDQVVETEAGATAYDTVWTNLTNYTLPDNVEIYVAINNSGSINGTGNDLTTLMLGNEGANVLNSLGGNDVILGRDGDDTINSGAGGDPSGYEVISGGAGADNLTGGGGHDYFNYELISHGGDVITDFATYAGADDDILDFRPMFPTFTNTAGITTVVQAVASGHLTYTQSGANVLVYADADGGADNNVLMVTLLHQTAADVQTYTLI